SISLESNSKINIPVLGLKLEGLDLTKHYINQPIELSVGTRFNSWAIAEHYFKECGCQKGFVVNRYRVEYHKSHLTPLNDPVKKRTYVCENAGKYKPNKTKLIEQQRNKGSKKTDCKWHVNLSNPETSNFVHITLVYLEHNHNISADNLRFAMAFQKFDESIMNEIERAVVYGHCDAYTIRNLLQPLFPGQLFLTQDLSNTIQKIKREKNVQKEDPTMFIQPLINTDSNQLSGIFWMTANQIMLWSRYSDLAAQAFLSDETQESYEWVLQQTLDATGSEPQVIITDMDPAIDAASKLGSENFKEFICDFWKAQNSLSIEVFEYRFQSLLEKYPSANKYL
ncbi:21044_t:CDS:2, partial [Racocetra persica]